MEPVTLTRVGLDRYDHPSGRPAVWWRDGGVWRAYYDHPGWPVLLDATGHKRAFPTPTLAASALGARLPAE